MDKLLHDLHVLRGEQLRIDQVLDEPVRPTDGLETR